MTASANATTPNSARDEQAREHERGHEDQDLAAGIRRRGPEEAREGPSSEITHGSMPPPRRRAASDPSGDALVHGGVPVDRAADLGGEALDRLGAHAESRNAQRVVRLAYRARQRDDAELVPRSPRGGEGLVGHVPAQASPTDRRSSGRLLQALLEHLARAPQLLLGVGDRQPREVAVAPGVRADRHARRRAALAPGSHDSGRSWSRGVRQTRQRCVITSSSRSHEARGDEERRRHARARPAAAGRGRGCRRSRRRR